MHWLTEMIKYHPTMVGVGAMWLFSNFVMTMPSPKRDAGTAYEWAFGFLHVLGAGIPRLIAIFAPKYANVFSKPDVPIVPEPPKP